MLSQIVMTIKGVILLTGAVYLFAALLRKEDQQWVKGAPLKMLVGLYVIGMWGHVVWLPFLCLLLSIPLLAKNRSDAASLYAIAVVSLPVLYYHVTIGTHYLLPFTKYMFAALALMIAYFAKPKSGPVLHSHMDIPILLLLGLEIAEVRDPDIGLMLRETAPVLFGIALPYFLISRSLNTPEQVRRFVLALALAGFAMALVATVEARTHWLVYKQIEGNLHISSQVNAYQKMRGGVIRSPASFDESTSLGNFLAIAAIAILALRSSFASKGKWFLAMAIMLVGLVAPNSRGAFLGFGIGIVLFDLYRGKWGGLFVKLAAGGGLYLILLAAANFSKYIAETVGKGADTQGSTDYRIVLLQRGIQEINRHPIFGTTLRKALANLEDVRQGEHIIDLVNGYINYGLVLGYTGMLGLLAMFLIAGSTMLAARKKLSANPVMEEMGAFVFSVAGLMMVVAAFTIFGGMNSTPFYEVLAVGSVLWGLRKTALARTGNDVAGSPVPSLSSVRSMILADREAARLRRAHPVPEQA